MVDMAWLGESAAAEEAYSIGARALLATGLQADYCIVTEASWEHPALGAFGKVLAQIDVSGQAAHASHPDEGINAAVEAARLVARLDELPLGRHPCMVASQCVLSVHSGNAQYVITVPETARILLNRHTVPEETGASVVRDLQDLVASLASPARFAVTLAPPFYPPWVIAVDHPLVYRFAEAYSAESGHAPAYAYSGFGDANLSAGEIPTIQFGPHGGNFHQADEWVDVPSIGATVRVLVRLALAVLQ